MTGNHFYVFGPFRLDPRQRELTRNGDPIPLRPKVFDTLLLLLERRGTLVSKAEMMAALWPDVAVEEGNVAWNVSVVRKALADGDEGANYIETIPKFGYRFVAEVRVDSSSAPESIPSACEPPVVATIPAPPRTRRWGIWPATTGIVTAAVIAIMAMRPSDPILEARDWVLVAEVENRTGDAEFDGVLADTVATQLAQSPFIQVLSRERIREQLELMRRPANVPLTVGVAREICERVGIKAFVAGSIAPVGGQYVLLLRAIDARTGDDISRQQHTVSDGAGVLGALGLASTGIRRELGESIQSLERFAVPPSATTSSLAALRAFHEGVTLMAERQSPKAVPFLRRAIELDRDFASAYSRLAAAYANLGDRNQAEHASRQAFERRDRVSERERYEIDAKYYRDVSGETSRNIETLEMWARVFPDESRAFNLLQIDLRDVGRLKEAAAAGERARALNPASIVLATNLIGSYIRLTDLDAAQRVADAASRDGLATAASTHRQLRILALLRNDRAALAREAEWSAKYASDQDVSDYAAAIAARDGRLGDALANATDAISRGESLARGPRATEYRTRLAGYQAYIGSPVEAAKTARQVLAGDPARYVGAEAAFFLALAAGDLSPMTTLRDRHPQDEILQKIFEPLANAVAAARQGRHEAAIPLLRSLGQHDHGDHAYLRGTYHLGQSLLATGSGAEARAAFQRLIDNRGIVALTPLEGLAYLGVARATAMSGSLSEARAAYDRFFEIWKDADADLPVMRQARAEDARLR